MDAATIVRMVADSSSPATTERMFQSNEGGYWALRSGLLTMATAGYPFRG